MKRINMILALDEKRGLGKDGDLAWRIREDMLYFKEITTAAPLSNFPPKGERIATKKNAVIMGRKTWDSIPEKFKPLPGRVNAILSRSFSHEDNFGDICKFSSLENAVEGLSQRDDIGEIFIIGGAQIYQYALEQNMVDRLYFTRVKGDYDCDVFVDINFDNFDEKSIGEWKESKNGAEFRFEVYKKK